MRTGNRHRDRVIIANNAAKSLTSGKLLCPSCRHACLVVVVGLGMSFKPMAVS